MSADMAETAPKIRLFVDAALQSDAVVALDRDQAHYLFSVMRLKPGDAVALFNGREGEWRADIVEAGKRGGLAVARLCTAAQRVPPDLWLLFCPLRKERTAFLVEKAVELGVRRFQPVLSRRTRSDRVRLDKMRAHAIEAAEQCGAVHVPELAEPRPLQQVLWDWPAERALLFCDTAPVEAQSHAALPEAPAALLIGPEGGFDAAEQDSIRTHPSCIALSLGPRILRAETAAIAATALWQAHAGDWR